MKKIDLHTHTNHSDGGLSPEELLEEAINAGLSAVAITDHDTISALEPAQKHSLDLRRKKKNIEFIPGVEIGCDEPKLGFFDVHLVGLFIDYKNKNLNNFLNGMQKQRILQKKLMINKLNNLGFDIKYEEIISHSSTSIGRPLIAKLLLKKYPSEFKSVSDVFDRYIGVGKQAYVEREKKPTIKEAIDLIHNAGGIAFLAHPGVFGKEHSLKLISFFKERRGDGIETYYSYEKICPELKDAKGLNKFYKKIAADNGLLESGGSDFHGKIRPVRLGEMEVPYSILVKQRRFKTSLGSSYGRKN